MITAERLRACTTRDALFALLADLGLPVAPVTIDVTSWRRAGIDIAWNGNASLWLAARVDGLDAYVIDGSGVSGFDVQRFLRSLSSYNANTKYVAIYRDCGESTFSVYDLSARRELRRLDLSPAAPTQYAVDRLNLLGLYGTTAPAKLFDRALDRETLIRHFFERFRDAVRDVAHALRSSIPGENEDAVNAQALLILSRLLFLYFVQEKGWLNGERRFLVDRLDGCLRDGREFYTCILAPLFFGCLNTPLAARDAAARALGRVPYLNGGLFEPSPFELRHPMLALPNALMQHVIEEVFERFAFSIDERDAAGTHIDPEMLGKVFESLMAADDRAATGSFYTPRAIVDVLTRRAICEWLADGDTTLRDALMTDDATLAPDVALALLAKLESLALLDPACGSGAFLLSALGVVERLTRALATIGRIDADGDLRRRIVERSLFGVDLKPEAVRLCELRLWLAIVADTDVAIEDVQPLPNLDRNILQGNALLAPTDFLGDGRAGVYAEWMYALRAQADLVRRYRHATRETRPALARLIRGNDRKLAAELLAKTIARDEDELQQLTTPRRDLFGRAVLIDGERCAELQERTAEHRHLAERVDEGELAFFSFDVHFAPVMANGGFGVIAGNPPWVRNARIDRGAKRMYADRFALFRGARSEESAAFNQPDLSIVFFERAVQLAKPGGVVSLLMPAKVLNAGYAAPLRRFATERTTIVALDDWSDDARRHFDADTFPLGVTVATTPRTQRIDVTSGGESFTMSPEHLGTSEWSLIGDEVASIMRRLRERHPPLATSLGRNPVMGVKSGDNRRFFLDVESVEAGHVITSDGRRIALADVARCVRGRDVRRWSASANVWMLWLTDRLAYVRPEHAGIKVVWKDLGRELSAAVVEEHTIVDGTPVPLVPNQTLYVLDAATLDEAHVIAAVLNSTVVNALAVAIAERAKDHHYRYFARTIARVPLPRIARGSVAWTALARMSRRAHQGRKIDDAELDRVVATLYGIEDREHAKLAAFVARRHGY